MLFLLVIKYLFYSQMHFIIIHFYILTWRESCIGSTEESTIVLIAFTLNWQNINEELIISICWYRNLDLWRFTITVLSKKSFKSQLVSYSLWIKMKPGLGQRRIFIEIESKIHAIISVFLGAMVLLPTVSSLLLLHCVSGKWE